MRQYMYGSPYSSYGGYGAYGAGAYGAGMGGMGMPPAAQQQNTQRQIQNAVAFLRLFLLEVFSHSFMLPSRGSGHPKAKDSSVEKKVGFLQNKGLQPSEIIEAFRRIDPNSSDYQTVVKVCPCASLLLSSLPFALPLIFSQRPHWLLLLSPPTLQTLAFS